MYQDLNILILGSESTRAAISILRALDGIENNIHVAISKSSKKDRFAFRKHVNNFWYYEDSYQKEFINSLISFQKSIGKLYIYCIGELKTEWMILNETILKSNNIFFEGPNLTGFKKMSVKPEFINTVLNYDISIPKELTVKEAKHHLDNKKPVVLKANDEKTLSKYKAPMIIYKKKKLTKIDFEKNNFIIQEYIDGPSVYYSAYYKEGIKIKSFEQINLVQQPNGGSVLKAAPFQIDKEILQKTDNMFHDLNWSGVMMIEYKLDNNKYYAIECNPRFWGPNQLLIDNGVNLPKLMLGFDMIENSDEAIKGYKWINGYILGFLHKIRGQGKFQRHKVDFNKKIKYFDLWNRKDTRLYFMTEVFLTTIVNRINKIVRRR